MNKFQILTAFKEAKNIIKRYAQVEKFKQWAKTQDDPEIQTLLRNDIVPIPSSSDAYLGSGAFSTVYEVLYNGQRLAAKVIRPGAKSQRELDAYTHIINLEKRIPAKYRKHFPKIYKIIDRGDDKIVIIEILDKMDPNIIKSYWGKGIGDIEFELSVALNYLYLLKNDKDYFRKSFISKFKSDELIDRIFFNNKLKVEPIISEHIMTGSFDPILSIISKKMTKRNADYSEILNTFYEAENMAEQILSDKKDIITNLALNSSYKNSAFRAVCASIIQTIRSTISGEKFPIFYSDSYPTHTTNNQINELIKALEYMREHHNILWQDMHRWNVMVRPSTGTLVAADVGLFSWA